MNSDGGDSNRNSDLPLEEAQMNVDDVEKHVQEATNGRAPSHRLWWQGNWSPLWVMGTLYLILFIIYMGLAELGHKSAAFGLHAVFALVFVLACAANLFHTPSHGPSYRTMHIWVGWTAMMSGTAVALTGFYMVFRTGYQVSISTTAQNVFVGTGIFQLLVQIGIVVVIRRKSVWYHMVLACVLFYAAALMPALNRLPQIFHFKDSDTFTFAIMPLGIVFVYFAIRYYAKQMLSRETNEQPF